MKKFQMHDWINENMTALRKYEFSHSDLIKNPILKGAESADFVNDMPNSNIVIEFGNQTEGWLVWEYSNYNSTKKETKHGKGKRKKTDKAGSRTAG